MRPEKIKPMTIKEYTKNFKFQDKKTANKGKDNLNKTQNILLYKILKKKNYKGNISMDCSSINKTLENNLNTEEKRKKIIKFLKRKNYEIPHTSVASPVKNREPGNSPTFFTGKNKNDKDLFKDRIITNYNIKSTKNTKNVISQYRAVTPIGNYRKNLNVSREKNNMYAAVYKKKDRENIFLNESQNNVTNESQINEINEKKTLNPKKNIRNLKYKKIKIKDYKKSKNNDKIEKKYNYLSSTANTADKQHEKLYISVNNSHNNSNIKANYNKKKYLII